MSDGGAGSRPGRHGRDFDTQVDIDGLATAADRLDELADTAELMGDEFGANRFREQAQRARLRAMGLLDD